MFAPMPSTTLSSKRSLAPSSLKQLTRHWGDWPSVSLYLDRCQVETPPSLVNATWALVRALRSKLGTVIDFGAGDGRFSLSGSYDKYIGYEIDNTIIPSSSLPSNALVINRCAFSSLICDADLCIGNPPYVRNQDLPYGWRLKASSEIRKRTNINISGLANAWQYFFLIALSSVHENGLCALVIPYEWLSRPSANALRRYIRKHQWHVDVYSLADSHFGGVLTTSCITLVDKSNRDDVWNIYEENDNGEYAQIPSATRSNAGVLEFAKRGHQSPGSVRIHRGLSPGTQKVLTLTEGERVRHGLCITTDVVPCLTSLRPFPLDVRELTAASFRRYCRDQSRKCWLVRVDRTASPALQAYFDSIPAFARQTATCRQQNPWWKFKMPTPPTLLVSQSFRGSSPKVLRNTIRACAIGGVCGIYNLSDTQAWNVVSFLSEYEFRDRIVPQATGVRKVEINQLKFLLQKNMKRWSDHDD